MTETFVGQSETLREPGVSLCAKAFFFALMARTICLIYQELYRTIEKELRTLNN